MAKDDKGKIRLIVFELEGSNETLQEGMKTVLRAMGQGSQPRNVTPPASLPSGNNGATLPSTNSESDAEDAEFREDDDDAPKTSAAKKTAKPRQYATPQVLDLDMTSGEMPFKTFYQQQNPTEHSKRYLVIAAWFKLYRNVDAITIDHIYTCYRLVNQNVLKDVGAVFRSLKHQGWMNSAQSRGAFAINHVGLNQVNDIGGS